VSLSVTGIDHNNGGIDGSRFLTLVTHSPFSTAVLYLHLSCSARTLALSTDILRATLSEMPDVEFLRISGEGMVPHMISTLVHIYKTRSSVALHVQDLCLSDADLSWAIPSQPATSFDSILTALRWMASCRSDQKYRYPVQRFILDNCRIGYSVISTKAHAVKALSFSDGWPLRWSIEVVGAE
jgi:hypothetical protein